jgi:F0F1-type ATP synthase assembly protein I
MTQSKKTASATAKKTTKTTSAKKPASKTTKKPSKKVRFTICEPTQESAMKVAMLVIQKLNGAGVGIISDDNGTVPMYLIVQLLDGRKYTVRNTGTIEFENESFKGTNKKPCGTLEEAIDLIAASI